jgi:thiosulfate/3-mercaptopyruvate sulfurtransferase
MRSILLAVLATSLVSLSKQHEQHGDYPARSQIFVDTDELDNMMSVRSESDLKIFDCSVAEDSLVSYHQSHIPGAGFIDLNYFRNMSSKYPFMLPGAQQFIDTMKAHGIKKSTRVVLYDKGNSYYATRVYWMLRTYGHEMASVLNGGYNKWVSEGRMTETTQGFSQGTTSDDFNYVYRPELYRSFEQVV